MEFISDGIDYDAVFPQFQRIMKKVNILLFCSNAQISTIMKWWEDRGYTAIVLIWNKPNPMPLTNGAYMSSVEFIIYIHESGVTYNSLGYDLQKKVFNYNVPTPQSRIHETEKPVALLEHLLMLHSNENDVVFDPYAGSFTTAIACHKQHRRFIGCEREERYYHKAIKRLKNIVSQQTLF